MTVQAEIDPKHVEAEAPKIFRKSAHKCGKVVSPKHRPPLLPREDLWYSFLLAAESIPAPAGRITSMKNLKDPTGNRIRDRPAFSTVSQRSARPRTAITSKYTYVLIRLAAIATQNSRCSVHAIPLLLVACILRLR